ncbi:MAG: hypothetical protein AB7U79_02565 [Candidatus Izemoplasmatales bacterium]
MKKSLFYSLGFLVLAILSGFALTINIVALLSLIESGGVLTEVIFFGTIFLVMFLLSLSQAVIWFLRFIKAKNINEHQK